jgi:hypothetical protein
MIGMHGCGPGVPLAPPPPLANPISMQVAPGLGVSLQAVGAVYLVVDCVDTKNRVVLPHLSEVIAGELRSATSADVIVLVDEALDCPPTAEWGDLCRACHVPIEGAPSSAVVVFCDVLEYDPYTPLRVSLSMRIRRVTDGVELVALQGTWIGTPPVTPRRPPFHWIRKKGPPRPNVDFVWTAQFEYQSATELVRNAAYQCVASLQSQGYGRPQALAPMNGPPQMDELIPPAPPALPEVMPPAMESPVEILPPPDAGQSPIETLPDPNVAVPPAPSPGISESSELAP